MTPHERERDVATVVPPLRLSVGDGDEWVPRDDRRAPRPALAVSSVCARLAPDAKTVRGNHGLVQETDIGIEAIEREPGCRIASNIPDHDSESQRMVPVAKAGHGIVLIRHGRTVAEVLGGRNWYARQREQKRSPCSVMRYRLDLPIESAASSALFLRWCLSGAPLGARLGKLSDTAQL